MEKKNHVAYHNTHSVLLFCVASVIFAYLLYSLYTCTHNRTTIWFCREKALITPTDVSYFVGQDGQESSVNLLATELFFLILAHPVYKI